jgi:hypothetical protein
MPGMAIHVDSSAALRGQQRLAALVDAVVAASPNDEADWIEWKTAVDLGQKEGQGLLARHILGMANRSCADAQRHCAGCGYLVIGAEPGAATGVMEVDPAVLDQGVQAYLGTGGPAWGMSYVQKDAVSVLVITVEPPAAGDRIRTLQKDFSSYQAGAVFVRRPGRTIQAQPGDIRALEDRYAEPLRLAESGRLRDRLERVGNTVEDLFWVVRDAPANGNPGVLWAEPRNRLRTLLIGLEDRLPSAAQIVNQGTALQAFYLIPQARIEIEAELRRLADGAMV